MLERESTRPSMEPRGNLSRSRQEINSRRKFPTGVAFETRETQRYERIDLSPGGHHILIDDR